MGIYIDSNKVADFKLKISYVFFAANDSGLAEIKSKLSTIKETTACIR